MLLGYARVSSLGQNLDRRIDSLTSAGVDPRMIYQEKITETKMQRSELNRLLNDIQQGDVLIIIRNLVASGTIEYYGTDKAVVPFTNVSTYNDFYVSLSLGFDDEPKKYDIKQGQSELVIETTLANEDLDNGISISPQYSIHKTNDGGYVHYTNYSYTIELQDLGYEQTSGSTKVGKVLQQEEYIWSIANRRNSKILFY